MPDVRAVQGRRGGLLRDAGVVGRRRRHRRAHEDAPHPNGKEENETQSTIHSLSQSQGVDRVSRKQRDL